MASIRTSTTTPTVPTPRRKKPLSDGKARHPRGDDGLPSVKWKQKMCLVGVEKNCPGENFAAAVGARSRWSRCHARAEQMAARLAAHFTFGPNDFRCGVLERVVSGDRGTGGLKDDPASDFDCVVGEPFVVAA